MGKKFYAMMAVLAFATGSMDVNAIYTLDGIEVSADRQKDRFGNMITEQSYYRTGGDVQVIDSDTIEKRHYTQVGDALCFYLWGGCHRRRHKYYYQEGGAEACRNDRFRCRIVETVQLRADLFWE